jgi:hypothetical protein
MPCFWPEVRGHGSYLLRQLFVLHEKPLFSGGGLAVSPRIRQEFRSEEITMLLKFHDRGYWGNVAQAVALSHNEIVAGERQGEIVSRYSWQKDEIMMVTERAGAGTALTKIYFVHNDVIVP